MLVGKAKNLHTLKGTLFIWALTLPTTIRPGWKDLTGTNTLAYHIVLWRVYHKTFYGRD